jgi:isocitrate dehydrogenase (NAD+)
MLMLRHLEEHDAAQRLEDAIAAVIAEGKSVTYDMKPSRDDPTAVGTSEYADAIIEKLQASARRSLPESEAPARPAPDAEAEA